MNFEYSPGLLGYGAKGTDGSLGVQGYAIYFTDLDPLTDLLKLESAIRNDEVLWAKAEPGTSLPEGRKYLTGDLFVTSRGYVYEIDAEIDEYNLTDGLLSKTEFFTTDGIYALQSFQRYFNVHDASIKYLIDSNKSSKSNYLFPSNIYSVNLKDFTRIEYTDGSAFTLYSSAETGGSDEHKALALIGSDGNFRMGNLQESVRNTNLIFDVSLLQYNRENDQNKFSLNTPTGTILTNVEKNTNLLFDPNFNSNPASFQYLTNGENSTITWNLADFTPDPDVKGTFVLCKHQPGTGSYSGSYVLNSSVFVPNMFYNLDTSGSFIVTDLSIGTYYNYYMILEKDGWERESQMFTKLQAGSPAYMLVLDPSSKTLSADASGWFSLGSSYKYEVDISTDSVTGWNVDDGLIPSWLDVSGGTGSGPETATFDVSLAKNTGSSTRYASIVIKSEAADQTISLSQTPETRYVTFDNYGKLVFTPALTDQTVNVTIQMGAWAAAHGQSLAERRVRVATEAWTKTGSVWTKKTNYAWADADSHGGGIDYDPTSTTWDVVSNTFSVTSAIDTSIYIKGNWLESNYWHPNDDPTQYIIGPQCDYEQSSRWVESMGYAYLTVNWNTGTGLVTNGTNRYYYWTNIFGASHVPVSTRQAASSNTAHPTVFP